MTPGGSGVFEYLKYSCKTQATSSPPDKNKLYAPFWGADSNVPVWPDTKEHMEMGQYGTTHSLSQ